MLYCIVFVPFITWPYGDSLFLPKMDPYWHADDILHVVLQFLAMRMGMWLCWESFDIVLWITTYDAFY